MGGHGTRCRQESSFQIFMRTLKTQNRPEVSSHFLFSSNRKPVDHASVTSSMPRMHGRQLRLRFRENIPTPKSYEET